jgi:hypothetical protein
MTPPLEVIGTDPDLLNALCRFFSILLSSFFEFLTIQYCSDEASSTSDAIYHNDQSYLLPCIRVLIVGSFHMCGLLWTSS